MTRRRLRARLAVAALGVTLLGGCGIFTMESTPPRVAAVGRVIEIDSNRGVLVGDFDGRRLIIDVDRRDMDRYKPGDEIRLDGAGRALPRN
jgi:hypothetical protein